MNNVNRGSVIDSLIYSLKNMFLIYIIITLPFYFTLNLISMYNYAMIIFIFIVSYYICYVFSKSIIETLNNTGGNLIGTFSMSVSILLLLLKNYNIIFIIFPVLLAFSSSIIDNSIKIKNIDKSISNLFMVLYFAVLVTVIIFFGNMFKLIYISFILILIAVGIISIIYEKNSMEYKKVTLNKRLKMYIISLSDIHRIKNLNALIIIILINSLLYMSVIMVFTFVSVLAVKYIYNYNIFIEKFFTIMLISFFTYFIGILIKNNYYYLLSFFGMNIFILLFIFIITIKGNINFLYYGLLLVPVIAFLMPGYYRYRNRKFMFSEAYYINKFVNFFSMFFIIISPLTGLYFYNKPRIVLTLSMLPMLIVIILALKFINYPDVIHIISKDKNIKIN